MKTGHGPILAVPYSAEIDAITLTISHHHESDVLFKRTIGAFDRLYAERPSRDGATRMLHFFGRPLHMIRHGRIATRAQ